MFLSTRTRFYVHNIYCINSFLLTLLWWISKCNTIGHIGLKTILQTISVIRPHLPLTTSQGHHSQKLHVVQIMDKNCFAPHILLRFELKSVSPTCIILTKHLFQCEKILLWNSTHDCPRLCPRLCPHFYPLCPLKTRSEGPFVAQRNGRRDKTRFVPPTFLALQRCPKGLGQTLIGNLRCPNYAWFGQMIWNPILC